MKKIIVIVAAAVLCSFNPAALAQADAGVAAGFLEQAKASGDSQLGTIASELAGKVKSLGGLLGGNAAVSDSLNSTLKSLTGGADSAALASAFNLVKEAKFTPEQLGLAKQVGSLTSAYVVQKNFAALEGQQGDVATIVSSLRSGKIKNALPSLKNVAASAKLTDTQKQLITTIADKYAPGLNKAAGALDSVKKFPGL
ncbi:MAG: hypothetical protein WCS42_15890 [Verrucomicrobiota bacterium]